jgi:hypothetical protein
LHLNVVLATLASKASPLNAMPALLTSAQMLGGNAAAKACTLALQ